MPSWVVTNDEGAGPRNPSTDTPRQAPASARRTSSVDVVRPEGGTGPVHIDARGRDVVLDADSQRTITDEQRIDARLDPMRSVVTMAVEPPAAAAAAESLIGRSVASGFRAFAAAAFPDDRRDATLLYLLLDDLPVATLVSGYALQRADDIPHVAHIAYEPTVDLCSGWRAGGTLMRNVEVSGRPPVTLGPAAPVLESAGDPDAWHPLPDAVTRLVRRRRRIDLRVRDALEVEAMFRDSHFDDDGVESVVHEYGLVARIDRETLVITDIEATARVLPYVECPAAADSATRLIGANLTDVRDRVRAEFVGTTTCTHLNDLLRSLEDVHGLWTAYRA